MEQTALYPERFMNYVITPEESLPKHRATIIDGDYIKGRPGFDR